MKNQIENDPLKSFIHIERGIIPKDLCRLVINTLKNCLWNKYTWNNVGNYSFSYLDNKFDVLSIAGDLPTILDEYITKSIKSYNDFIGEEGISKVTKFSPVRFNRYQKNQKMEKHSDHITFMFDGEIKGIPILSIIINLNDDYKGGDLIFWDDYRINLGEGDIVVFPSLFLFPHRIEEVTENVRYSGIVWAV